MRVSTESSKRESTLGKANSTTKRMPMDLFFVGKSGGQPFTSKPVLDAAIDGFGQVAIGYINVYILTCILVIWMHSTPPFQYVLHTFRQLF